jgi:hypothetical protein
VYLQSVCLLISFVEGQKRSNKTVAGKMFGSGLLPPLDSLAKIFDGIWLFLRFLTEFTRLSLRNNGLLLGIVGFGLLLRWLMPRFEAWAISGDAAQWKKWAAEERDIHAVLKQLQYDIGLQNAHAPDYFLDVPAAPYDSDQDRCRKSPTCRCLNLAFFLTSMVVSTLFVCFALLIGCILSIHPPEDVAKFNFQELIAKCPTNFLPTWAVFEDGDEGWPWLLPSIFLGVMACAVLVELHHIARRGDQIHLSLFRQLSKTEPDHIIAPLNERVLLLELALALQTGKDKLGFDPTTITSVYAMLLAVHLNFTPAIRSKKKRNCRYCRESLPCD